MTLSLFKLQDKGTLHLGCKEITPVSCTGDPLLEGDTKVHTMDKDSAPEDAKD